MQDGAVWIFEFLLTAAAGLAVAATFFNGFARSGKYRSAIAPFGGLAAVGT